MTDRAASPFRYWAFISYSRHDTRVARLVADALARERVPRTHRHTVQGSPSRFEPIFLDFKEAAAAPRLDEELQSALRASARLIVLCSPFAVRSKYVEEEIRFFQEEGRGDQIVCLIISGVPGAASSGDEALECFPQPLRETSAAGEVPSAPLAAALGTETRTEWRHAIDQLAAGLLGLPLEHRREWLRRRRLRRFGTATATLGAVAAAAYGVAWALWFPQQLYARDGVRRWGAWQPLDRMAADVAERRPQTLRFSRRGALGPWTEVRWVDGSGQCAVSGPDSIVGDAFEFQCTRSHACGVRVTVGRDRRAASEQVFDQYGQALETLTYSVPGRAVLNEAVIGCSRRPGDIDYVELDRQPDGPLAGMDRQLRFFGGDEKSPRPNASYEFGATLEYDSKGHVVQVSSLDATGHPRLKSSGYAALRYRYNDAGDLIGKTMLGLDGQPVVGRDGYATEERQVDTWGRPAVRRYLDVRGMPTANSHGVYEERLQWDDRGRLVQRIFLGPEGKPIVADDGVGSVRHEYLEGGSRDRESYFDAEGRPTWNGSTGCATTETTTDRPGQAWIEQRCFGPDGRPTIGAFGWHRMRTSYSPQGQLLAEEFFGIDAKPVMCRDMPQGACPLHRMQNTFDERGNRVRSRFYGLSGQPTIAGTGTAGVDVIYNPQNRVRRWINVGLDGKLGRDRAGIYAEERLYDSYGRLAEIRNVDASGHPLPAAGFYGRHFEFDDYGNIRETHTFDRNGGAVAVDGTIAITRSRFDDRGREVERRNFDARDRPTTDAEGWYGAAFERDIAGRVIRSTRLGPDGGPEPDDDGVLTRSVSLDERGHRVKLQLLGVAGAPVARRDGTSSWIEEVDVRGHKLFQLTLGLLGQPIADRFGVAGFRARYDARGNQVVLVRIGPDRRPIASAEDGIAIVVTQFDERDRVAAKYFYDARGNRLANRDGVFGFGYRYDPSGREIEGRNLSADGKLTLNGEGVARWESEYDSAEALSETRYFDANGAPVNGGAPAIVRHRNDDQGREIERTFFDDRGRPMMNPSSGRWRAIFERDAFGRLVSERSQGPAGEAVNRSDMPWSWRTLTYGDMGQLVEVRCFDKDGARVVEGCGQTE